MLLPQLSSKELTADAEHTFSVVCQDPNFKDIIPSLLPKNVSPLVDEVLHILYHDPTAHKNNPPLMVHTDSCMVISLLLQWLSSYMIRRLLQLMTPEALIVNIKQIPVPYREMYLRFQEHFSIKELINNHLEKLELNNW